MNLTLGINNCFAVKRWPRPDEWAQIVRDELSLDVVQHSLDLTRLHPGSNDGAGAVREACADAGVSIHSVFTGLIAYSANLMLAPEGDERSAAVSYWSGALRFAARVGARRVGGHVGSLSRRDADDPARRRTLWAELGEHLEALSAEAHRHHLDALLVENMACDREPCRMADIHSLLRDPDPGHAGVELCLDIGHQCVPGVRGEDSDPYAWLAQLGARASVVHLQQSDAAADHHWPFTPDYNRRGRIRAPLVLEALASSGASDVALILEVIPSFEADDDLVLEDLRESVSHWQQALRDFQRG
jgi:sugar phosphate isomerase/epimerase